VVSNAVLLRRWAPRKRKTAGGEVPVGASGSASKHVSNAAITHADAS
jgi:hypothetical protein